MPVARTPWNNFPNVIVHTTIDCMKRHHAYAEAKLGDLRAARAVVRDLLRPQKIDWRPDYIAPVLHLDANERWNAIPLALAEHLAATTGAKLHPTIVQDNDTRHTGADGIHRLTKQPSFVGIVSKGSYMIVDDVVTFGSTLANLRGHIETNGGKVAAASTLAAAIFATKLTPDSATISTLKNRFRRELPIIPEKLGFPAECLTNKEAHFVHGLTTLESIKNPNAPTHRVIRASL
jgi:predicted amidophosphoribosyltransferase